MDSKHIEQLLEHYWRCETSLEEEARLRDYFNSGEEIPARLHRYKELFAYQLLQREERLDAGFDAKVLAQVETPVVKARRLSLWARLVPLCKAAAVVAVVVVLSNVAQHSFFKECKDAAVDTISEQVSAPSVALSGEASADHEKQLLDSLHHMDKSKIETTLK